MTTLVVPARMEDPATPKIQKTMIREATPALYGIDQTLPPTNEAAAYRAYQSGVLLPLTPLEGFQR